MRKREIEIEPPIFETIDDFYEYAQRRAEPQEFVDKFVGNLKGLKPFVKPIFDAKLLNAGSARVETGKERIRIGEKALIRDSELFKTIFHEEMHLRLWQKAVSSQGNALELVTNPNRFPEEDYAERVALRYFRFYTGKFGKFKH